jgi:hypothetical protein
VKINAQDYVSEAKEKAITSLKAIKELKDKYDRDRYHNRRDTHHTYRSERRSRSRSPRRR